MIDATATLEHPGALKIHATIVAPTEAVLPLYQAIAEAMKSPGHSELVVKFDNGAIVVDLELHTDEHVDHLKQLAADIKDAGKQAAGAVVAGGKKAAAAVKKAAGKVAQEVENLADPKHNAAAGLTDHEGPGPNEDAGAESETSGKKPDAGDDIAAAVSTPAPAVDAGTPKPKAKVKATPAKK